ncbi:MAG TPA: ABC transporter substrate-binding protein [Propionicimonas sp.]|uniref:ABC transporter substrate-binding protein n=1 Tax=Propionicimonas sp. TaxID=1955623 RepID=UPI002F42942A
MLAAAATFGALLVTAACSSAGTPGASTPAAGGVNWDERGPITYAQGKDTAGVWKDVLAQWNSAHPNEQVTFVELSPEADQQRADMIKRGQAKSGEFSVMSVDVVWTSEFAANGFLQELPADRFPTTGMLKSAVDASTYFNKLYAYPQGSDGAMLYYRKDLLDKAGLQAPKTWAEMQAACDKVLPDNKGMSCYAGQHQKYEGLTCNIAEAVNSAGGEFITADGKPAVNTPQAIAGLQWMVDGFKSGMIPADAITWKEEEGRQAFQDGKLLFHRNWPYVWNLASKDDGSSKIVGKFAVSPLPGKDGPGVSTLGGHNIGISAFTKNKGTAGDFIKFIASEPIQKTFLEKGSLAPILENLYGDAALNKQFPYLSTLGESIKTAKSRPKAVKYGDVTLAIQDATYAALQKTVEPAAAFGDLQTKLEGLLK